ncbi:MAG: methylated-DNA--[protein]-cysteine S-methyltransferase [Chloroflexi bacterium]|nr:methylated-DNA--[protein]-cysteine S-methyltransferase [Chloroflexota bacterium]
MGLVASPEGLLYGGFPQPEPARAWERLLERYGSRLDAPEGPAGALLEAAAAYFTAYFAGERGAALDAPLVLAWLGTPFEGAVWEATCRIPYGETLSYGEVAALVGRPAGPRAVGQALGRNRAGLLVPCHRVIAAGGRLGGYGGYEDRKARLLALEGVRVSQEGRRGRPRRHG